MGICTYVHLHSSGHRRGRGLLCERRRPKFPLPRREDHFPLGALQCHVGGLRAQPERDEVPARGMLAVSQQGNSFASGQDATLTNPLTPLADADLLLRSQCLPQSGPRREGRREDRRRGRAL